MDIAFVRNHNISAVRGKNKFYYISQALSAQYASDKAPVMWSNSI